MSREVVCPSGFVFMYDGCYTRNAQALPWIDASIAAVDQNATLAAIHSEPQNRWIGEHLRRKGWLSANLWRGLNDIAKEGDWVQADGSDAQFGLWARWEPSTNSGENCARLDTDLLWYQEQCANAKPSLIRWNASATYPRQGTTILACSWTPL